ncbi:MAG: ABC transporter permease [Actinomycetales bacterium]|nr:ABC transporter permease [Actinomycetales bacterium]
MTTTTAPTGATLSMSAPTRTGWLRAFALSARWEWASLREWAVMMVVIQFMMGVGMAIMYGFFYPELTPTTAVYITTGIPTLALIPLGFIMIPGGVGEQRMNGSFDFVWSLPVPRSAQLAAMFALYTLLSLPGTVLSLVVAAWRFGVSLDVSWLVLPAVVLAALMAVSVGSAMAFAIANPMVTNLISNALVFVVLLFSPIVYPAANLPGWLAGVHSVLPFEHMATAIRAGLTDGFVTDVGRSFVVLGAWAVAGAVITGWVARRRG